jgi:hypothetical protein
MTRTRIRQIVLLVNALIGVPTVSAQFFTFDGSTGTDKRAAAQPAPGAVVASVAVLDRERRQRFLGHVFGILGRKTQRAGKSNHRRPKSLREALPGRQLLPVPQIVENRGRRDPVHAHAQLFFERPRSRGKTGSLRQYGIGRA